MKKNKKISKKQRVIWSGVVSVAIIVGGYLFNQFVFIKPWHYQPAQTRDKFRVALSVSPFSATEFEEGYTYQIGDQTITTQEALQQAFIDHGSTEMYTRIGTKRTPTAEDITYGKPDTNANVHTLDQGLALAKLAAKLGVPLNPEIMGAYTYMDMFEQQAPDFSEYPELLAMQKGKSWQELTLEEMLPILQAYGTFVATQLLETGVTIENWNIGNEANFGFAGVNVGLETAVNPALADVPDWRKNILSILETNWLKENVWAYNAKQMNAVKTGILQAYQELGISSEKTKFSTHIATVASTVSNVVSYFETLKENGFDVDVAGISYYPSAPSARLDKIVMYKQIVTAINQQVNIPVFIAEFSYPSGDVSGPFSSWTKEVAGYPHTENGQSAFYQDIVHWGKDNGLIGIRYWAPDYSGWNSMSMFDYDGKTATAKEILLDSVPVE
ncbi:glycosyl hydrolase 53 family protein [Enterococcus sp.]|uniref:glycosyl hydrolase 53 family protein n=1 Tax=Enterococcus sp. TaxID=35783 RepID=UPI0028977C39|nr:glycosyl hydrolase 53 family protein [Enterococcus sp.]